MTSGDSMPLPPPTFAGGTKAITTTPIVGAPRREYAETFVPGDEPLEDGELRVTVLGSGNPWVTRAQASASILVEVGNPERDVLVFDLGSGSLANYASLKLPVNKLDKVFLTHLHADHTADLLTLSGSYAKVGRADGPVKVWGPSGTEPRLGTRRFCQGIEMALAWDSEAGRGPINEDSMRIVAHEFDWSQTGVVYEENGVRVTSFPVVHSLSGAVGYRVDFAGLSFSYSGAVVQTQDLTVFNVTKEAVVARQAQVMDQLPPIPGEQRVAFVPVLPTPPAWWAEARIPLE